MWKRDELFVDLVLTDPKGPDAGFGTFQFAENVLVVGRKVLVEDDVDTLVVELDWSSAENRDFGDVRCSDHGVEDGCADQASGAGQDEMHFVRGKVFSLECLEQETE